MTRNDLPKLVSTWGPIVGLLLSGAVAWTTLQHDVQQKLDTERFKLDSLNVHHDLTTHAEELRQLKANATTLDQICRAVRCGR